jgi:CTP synthase (UTP-ammonia lyase)
MRFSGVSPDGRLIEYIELRDHPWFVATQAHPELKSRPNRPHPLFRDFVGAAAGDLAVSKPPAASRKRAAPAPTAAVESAP